MVKVADFFSSLIDFPPYPSLIMFTTGCNLRCKYCYNWQIALDKLPEDSGYYTLDDVYNYIKQHNQYIMGLVVSGGEPSVHQYDPEFYSFLSKVSNRVLLKLDSNGTIEYNPAFIDLFFGVSITLKPITYYPRRYEDLDVLKKNILLANQCCTYKELRITATDEIPELLASFEYIAPYLVDTLSNIKRNKMVYDKWNITINKAIHPNTSTTLADDQWQECSYTQLDKLKEEVKNICQRKNNLIQFSTHQQQKNSNQKTMNNNLTTPSSLNVRIAAT